MLRLSALAMIDRAQINRWSRWAAAIFAAIYLIALVWNFVSPASGADIAPFLVMGAFLVSILSSAASFLSDRGALTFRGATMAYLTSVLFYMSLMTLYLWPIRCEAHPAACTPSSYREFAFVLIVIALILAAALIQIRKSMRTREE